MTLVRDATTVSSWLGLKYFANSSKQMRNDKWLIGETSDRTSDFECRHQSGPTSRWNNEIKTYLNGQLRKKSMQWMLICFQCHRDHDKTTEEAAK